MNNTNVKFEHLNYKNGERKKKKKKTIRLIKYSNVPLSTVDRVNVSTNEVTLSIELIYSIRVYNYYKPNESFPRQRRTR